MARGKPATVEQWVEFLQLRRNGIGRGEAARTAGVSPAVARTNEQEKTSSRNWRKAKEQIDLLGAANVVQIDELVPEARQALSSIETFALRYFGVILMPFQVEAAEAVFELLESPDEEYLTVNAPPGSGKSTFFTKILPAFATVRQRAIRGMIGSATARQAEWYTRRLRSELEREHVARAELNDQRLGLAVDAVSTLQSDYGVFRPDSSELWRAEAFVVLQPDGVPLSQKEPTWSAFGMDTAFLGGRFDLVLWDDVWDPRKMRNSESRTDMFKWWDEVAETRLEPGGLLVNVMQRMAPDDISRYCLDKAAPVEDDEVSDQDEPGEGMVSEESSEQAAFTAPSETPSSGSIYKYKHLSYRAHYEDLCEGNHRRDSAPWPEGCLLYPRRLPWSKLRHIKADTPDRYEILYQQEDTNPASVLVDPIWVSGGTGLNGVEHIGCWDPDRDLWELPPHIDGDPITIATADPSPSQFWALQCWSYVGETDFRYLLECYRQKMDAPSFLDWNHNQQTFSGIAEDWWQISNDRGYPIRYWIVEVNAAQKFILQYDHFKRWSQLRGVELIPHFTARNKADPKYGVQMLATPWRLGRVRLPGKQNTMARPHSLLLVNEVTKWNPEGTGARTDDEVMAQWFLEHNLERIYTPPVDTPMLRRPSWMRQPTGA